MAAQGGNIESNNVQQLHKGSMELRKFKAAYRLHCCTLFAKPIPVPTCLYLQVHLQRSTMMHFEPLHVCLHLYSCLFKRQSNRVQVTNRIVFGRHALKPLQHDFQSASRKNPLLLCVQRMHACITIIIASAHRNAAVYISHAHHIYWGTLPTYPVSKNACQAQGEEGLMVTERGQRPAHLLVQRRRSIAYGLCQSEEGLMVTKRGQQPAH
eukprot:1157786-Pelagomonas_calceolata.AAC.3